MTDPISPQNTSHMHWARTPSSVYSSSPSSASSIRLPAPELTFDVDTAYREQQALRDWISSQGFRSAHFLPTLHRESFIVGIIWLRARIDEMIQADREMYLEHRMLLTDTHENRLARASTYTGWYFHVPGPEQLDALSRLDLQQILESDLNIFDDVRRSNKKWRVQIDKLEERKRLRLQEERRRRRRMAIIDDEREVEMEMGEGSGGPVDRRREALSVHFEEDEDLDFRQLLDHLSVQGQGHPWGEYYAVN